MQIMTVLEPVYTLSSRNFATKDTSRGIFTYIIFHKRVFHVFLMHGKLILVHFLRIPSAAFSSLCLVHLPGNSKVWNYSVCRARRKCGAVDPPVCAVRIYSSKGRRLRKLKKATGLALSCL